MRKIKGYLEKWHLWMKKDPGNNTTLEGLNIILFGVNSLLLSDLIMPNAFGAKVKEPFILPIIGITISVLWWGTLKIIEIITEKKITIPLKYKFLFLLLFIPLLFLINKAITWFKFNHAEQNSNNN